MSQITRTPDEFLAWLFSLKLPKEPHFKSNEERRAFGALWRDALKNESEAGFEAAKYFLLPTMKFFPTLAHVLEILQKVKIPPKISLKAYNEYYKFKGKDIYPGFTVASQAQKDAIEKILPNTSSLPKVNLETGSITIDGRAAGNVSEYEIDARIKKIKERR